MLEGTAVNQTETPEVTLKFTGVAAPREMVWAAGGGPPVPAVKVNCEGVAVMAAGGEMIKMTGSVCGLFKIPWPEMMIAPL